MKMAPHSSESAPEGSKPEEDAKPKTQGQRELEEQIELARKVCLVVCSLSAAPLPPGVSSLRHLNPFMLDVTRILASRVLVYVEFDVMVWLTHATHDRFDASS